LLPRRSRAMRAVRRLVDRSAPKLLGREGRQ
jgi:hypothetical protein